MSKNFGFTEAEIYRGLYEKYKDDPGIDTGDLERKSRVFEHLGHALDIDPAAALMVMDTGIYNEYIKAYVYGAMNHAGLDQDTQQAVIKGLAAMLDTYTAAEILKMTDQATGSAAAGRE